MNSSLLKCECLFYSKHGQNEIRLVLEKLVKKKQLVCVLKRHPKAFPQCNSY